MRSLCLACLLLLLCLTVNARAQTEEHNALGYQDSNGRWHAYDTTGAGVPVQATFGGTVTTSATAASSLPTLSAGPTATYQSLTGGQYVQPIFGSTIVNGSNGLPVNCILGCAGGTSSNATSGVATSSTNGQTLAFGYAFNGTTWDRLTDDGSKNLNVDVAAGTVALGAGSATIGALTANQSVNLSQVNGVTTLTGTGASGTGAQRVTVSGDTATIAGSAPGTAGTASSNVVTTQGIASMTPLLVNPGTAANWGVVAQASTTSGQSGSLALSASTTAAPSYTTAQTNALSTDLNGGLRVSPMCNKVINVAQTATTDVKTFTGFGYICSIMLVSATAQNIGLDEGTGTTCESSGTALIGVSSTALATAQVPLAANGGFSMVSAQAFLRTQTSADHLCVVQSSTGEVAGTITYADLTN